MLGLGVIGASTHVRSVGAGASLLLSLQFTFDGTRAIDPWAKAAIGTQYSKLTRGSQHLGVPRAYSVRLN
ncbi:protein of unknown function [Candidatus Filomicrobium marinum]|uniref:Uncharacterized protein n=1 Tax=Candidatus Filomicrobium marinum TaxID=1608628 RepID=A0A0D6JA84_9HYPH|nr:protein of unknown function [Candidatus Filomicrobium marinum]CPR15357.1 protein of unknown function [Candidatus Filomicrobium marinum]